MPITKSLRPSLFLCSSFLHSMVRKKIDNRIRLLIENGVITKHRSMFFIVGDKGRDQVPVFDRIRPNHIWTNVFHFERGWCQHVLIRKSI